MEKSVLNGNKLRLLQKLSLLRRMNGMRRRYNPYRLPPWLRTVREVCSQLIIPFCIFQGIRTILLPTTFDVVLLMIFVLIAVGFYFEFL